MFIIPDLAPVVFTKVVRSRKKVYTIKIVECGNLRGNREDCLCWTVYDSGKEAKSIPNSVASTASWWCKHIPAKMPFSFVSFTAPLPQDHRHKLESWRTHSGYPIIGCLDCGHIESVGKGA